MMKSEKPQDLLDWLGIRKKPDWTRARPLGTILGGVLVLVVPALFIFAIVAAFAVVGHTIYLSFTAAKTGINLGTGALIAAMLGAPFVIWGTFLKYQTVRYQKEGHITDRINKAVEQLGAEKTVKKIVGDQTQETTEPNIEVRIGAILSLERIAQDSTIYDNGRDHVRVMEILCAYVRENSKARPPEDFPEPDWEPLADDASAEEKAARHDLRLERFGEMGFGGKARKWAIKLPKPRPDIAQALHVLGRRTPDQRRVEAAWPAPPTRDTVWPFDIPCPRLPDLGLVQTHRKEEIAVFTEGFHNWQATSAAYSGYRLDLRGANLQGADLSAKRPDGSDAVFSGALLTGTRMEGADLRNARMEGTDLSFARMEGARLSDARMEGADLSDARMEGAHLNYARMEGADLSDAEMQGAAVIRPHMEGANLSNAQLEGAFLLVVRLEGANLSKVRMYGSEDLSTVHLDAAALRSADHTDVPASAEQINSMFGDASVTLPKDIQRPAHWPDWELPDYGTHDFHSEWREWQADPDGYVPLPKPEE